MLSQFTHTNAHLFRYFFFSVTLFRHPAITPYFFPFHVFIYLSLLLWVPICFVLLTVIHYLLLTFPLSSSSSQIIASKATGQNPPILQLEGTSFVFIRHKNLFLVAATKGNPNVALIFEYLFQKIRILKSYLGNDFDDEELMSNFTLVYELFDETMDYGYPQNCATDVLQLYINLGSTFTL